MIRFRPLIRLLFLLPALGLGSLSLYAEAGEEALLQAVLEPVGRLEWDSTYQAADEIPQGPKHEFRFPFRVEGNGSIKILGVHQDCGCLSTSIKAGQSFAQGSTGEVKVLLDTQAFSGAVDKSITFLTNENRGRRVHQLRIKARIKKLVDIEPPLVSFDWSQPKTEAVIRVSSLKREGLHIQKIDYNLDLMDVAFYPVPGAWEVKVKWKGEVPTRPIQENLKIVADQGLWDVPVIGSRAH